MWYSREKFTGHLLFGSKFVRLSILLALFIIVTLVGRIEIKILGLDKRWAVLGGSSVVKCLPFDITGCLFGGVLSVGHNFMSLREKPPLV